jgi:hypothetical protein
MTKIAVEERGDAMTLVCNCDQGFVMSRSLRRPYAAITGTASAKDDKRHSKGYFGRSTTVPKTLSMTTR